MGRHLKFEEETAIMSFRVPKSMIRDVKKYVSPYIWKKINELRDIKEGIKLEKEIKKNLNTIEERFDYKRNLNTNLDNKTKKLMELMQKMDFKFKMFSGYRYVKLKDIKEYREKVILIVNDITRFLNAQISEYLDYDSPKKDFWKPRQYERIDREGDMFTLEEIQYKIKKQLNYWYVRDLPDRYGFFQNLIRFKKVFEKFLENENEIIYEKRFIKKIAD